MAALLIKSPIFKERLDDKINYYHQHKNPRTNQKSISLLTILTENRFFHKQ
jgi:hypothetical protein